MAMNERILDAFLDRGLLDLKGQDAWFAHITKAADVLAVYLREHPDQLSLFAYSAIDPGTRADDPAREKAREVLRDVWRTFSSVSIGGLDLVLRGIILDALVRNAERDSQTRLALTLILASALPYVSVGAEEKVWQQTLEQMVDEVEAQAEADWSVPSSVNLPEISDVGAPTLSVKLGGTKFDEGALLAGLEKAAGPQNAQSQQTGGNPHWPNQPQPWAHHFPSFAAEAIGAALKEVGGVRSASMKSDPIVKAVADLVQDYVEDVARRLAAAAHGVEMRSRLLWWKEAMISPSARVDYRELEPMVAPGLMAFDFQDMLPALAPASVSAFLRQTVRALNTTTKANTLVDYLEAIASTPYLDRFRNNIDTHNAGLRPLAALARGGKADVEVVRRFTIFDPMIELSPDAFAALLFLELQAMKAVEAIEPIAAPSEQGPNDDSDEAQKDTADEGDEA